MAGPHCAVVVSIEPFVNISQHIEDDWISTGIAETISIHLYSFRERAPVKTPAADRKVPSGPDKRGTLPRGCGSLTKFRINGAFQRIDTQLRLTARIVDDVTGMALARLKLNSTTENLFAAQDQLGKILLNRLERFNLDKADGFASKSRLETLFGESENQLTAAHEPALLKRPLENTTPKNVADSSNLIPIDQDVDSSSDNQYLDNHRATEFELRTRPRIRPVRTTNPPSIDGHLDDEIWSNTTPITNFVQTSPVEGAPGTEQTEVWIAYDRDYLYVAFYAHYSVPGIIRANRAERDQTMGDDQMSILIDPFLDQQRAYQFSVNGFGVQGDSIVNAGGTAMRSRSSVGRSSGGASSGSGGSSGGGGSSSGFGIRGDRSWNTLFESSGRLVDDGWMAEMAIPFKSLRYPARPSEQPHQWGLQISRNIREKSESLVWSPVSRDIAGQLTQMGFIEGLTDLSTSRNLEFLPTFTGVQTGALDALSGQYDERDPLGETGFGVKYGVTSNLTMDFTYNPDFSQIESDRPQVEVNQRFALFYSEQRPFFLEGQEIFSSATPVNLVHTRTIVDPRYGAKLTGKVGATSIGVFIADDEAPGRLDDPADPAFGRVAQSLIGRVRYDLYPESYIGVIATARELGQDYNRLGGIDGRFRLGQTHSLSFTTVRSTHQDSTTGQLDGSVFEVDFTRQARNFSYGLSHSSIDPQFRSATGFVPRVDIRRTDANISYRWRPEGTLISWGPSFTYLRNYSHAGMLEDEQFRTNVNFEFVRNVRFSGGVNRDLERFGGINFRKTNYSFFGLISSQRFSIVGGMNGGDGIYFSNSPFLGRSTDGNISFYFRPTSRLRTEFRTIFSRFTNPTNATGIFDVKVFRWRASYQFTERLLARHILEHNTLSGTLGNNLLLTYRINSGTVAFLGYDDRFQRGNLIDEMFFSTEALERTNRAFFTKISYLFRY